jgi:hypothetical protein
VPLDPRQCGGLLRQLRPPQRLYGWRLIYGDPADDRNAYRHAFRERLAKVVGYWDSHAYILFAKLTDVQWEKLQTDGLTWGVDVVAGPDAYDRHEYWGNWRAYKEGHRLCLEGADPAATRGWRERLGVTSVKRFCVYRDGRESPDDTAWDDPVALGVVVEPKSCERLVEAGGAGQ